MRGAAITISESRGARAQGKGIQACAQHRSSLTQYQYNNTSRHSVCVDRCVFQQQLSGIPAAARHPCQDGFPHPVALEHAQRLWQWKLCHRSVGYISSVWQYWLLIDGDTNKHGTNIGWQQRQSSVSHPQHNSHVLTHPCALPLPSLWPFDQLLLHTHCKHKGAASTLTCPLLPHSLTTDKGKFTQQRTLYQVWSCKRSWVIKQSKTQPETTPKSTCNTLTTVGIGPQGLPSRLIPPQFHALQLTPQSRPFPNHPTRMHTLHMYT